MPSLDGFKIAKHTKGNKDGLKAERPNIRAVPKSRFKKIASIEDVFVQLVLYQLFPKVAEGGKSF